MVALRAGNWQGNSQGHLHVCVCVKHKDLTLRTLLRRSVTVEGRQGAEKLDKLARFIWENLQRHRK